MWKLSRRTAFRSGLGAGIATLVVPRILGGTPALGAVGNRVRLTRGSAYGATRTSMPVSFPAPAAGNLLLTVVSIDASAGTFVAPTGWRIAFQRVGASVSLAALYRVATGSETTQTFSWTTPSPGGSWLVAEYTNIDGADPLGRVRAPAYSDVARTSLALSPAAAEAPCVQIAVLCIDAMDPQPTDGSEFRPSSPGWDWITTSHDGTRAACPGTALAEYGSLLSQGEDLPSSRFTWRRSDQVVGATLALNTAPALVSRWVGAVRSTGATVAVKLAGASSSARLKVSSDPGLTIDPAYSAAASPDPDGMAKLVIHGLAPGTQYHYAVETDGVVDTSRVGSFRTGPATAESFVFAFGSCCGAVGADTFSKIRAHDPGFFVHLGDLHYADIAVNDPALYRARYDAALASAHQGPLYANVPTVYTWSDHDYGANGSNSTSVSKPAAQTTYRQYVPSYPLPSPTGGIYQTFTYGRVRFIVTDNRSYKSPRSAPDNVDKTMLGAEQKQWFKNVVSTATEPVIIWINENPWISAAAQNLDTWGGYTTERAELADFITASGAKVAIVSGDMHALAADDGSNSAGGIPVFQAAAMNGKSAHKGGPYTHGPFPSTLGLTVRQYGVMSVVDSGTRISLKFSGYGSSGSVELAYTHVFPV